MTAASAAERLLGTLHAVQTHLQDADALQEDIYSISQLLDAAVEDRQTQVTRVLAEALAGGNHRLDGEAVLDAIGLSIVDQMLALSGLEIDSYSDIKLIIQHWAAICPREAVLSGTGHLHRRSEERWELTVQINKL